MKDGDIEIRIEKKYYAAADGGGLRTREFKSTETNYGIGTYYNYNLNNTLEYISRFGMKHQVRDITHYFYKTGSYSAYWQWTRNNQKKCIDYHHSWWKNGYTKEIQLLNNGAFHSPTIDYRENGTIRNKIYYKEGKTKDYARCYWNGPRLPSSADGAILRKAIPIVNRMGTEEAEEEKGPEFNLATLEDAALREEDVGTL